MLAGGSGGGGTGGAGNGGAAGSPDAGPDASDAGDPSLACVLGTLEQYCDADGCPPLAGAREDLREWFGLAAPAAIVQRPCSARDGSARLSVSANYRSMSRTLIYDAQSEQLVGVEIIDDLGVCSDSPTFGEPGFGSGSGYYGEAASPECSSGFPDFVIPAGCDPLDAGAPATGAADAGTYECVVTP